MHHHSKNVGKLKSLFTFPQRSMDESYMSNFDKNLKFKALAILLANAELATPELNRETVKDLLKGKISWPKTDGSSGKTDNDIDIEKLEVLGILSFYTDYCNVHIYLPDKEDITEDIKPYYTALKMLQNIMRGDDGYVESHFRINKMAAKDILQGESINIDLDSIPELICNGEFYKIELSHGYFKNMLNEYLWQALNVLDADCDDESDRTLSEKEKLSFKRWLLISRVYPDSFLWNINFDFIENTSKSLFIRHVLSLIEEDLQLRKPQQVLGNKWLCESNLESASSILRNVKDESFNRECEHAKSNLVFIRRYKEHETSNYRSDYNCYYCFVTKIAEDDIYVDNQSIHSYGKLEKLLILSDERPELRHILFNYLPIDEKIDYLLYLLCKIETTATAVYLFINKFNYIDRVLIDSSPSSLHKIAFPLVCDEFINICFKNPYNKVKSEDIAELLICLAKDSIHEGSAIESRVNTDCLNMLLNSFSLEQISYFANVLLSEIISNDTNKEKKLESWNFFLLFWLLEKCQDFGLLVESDIADRIQTAIVDIYSIFFNANIDSSEAFYVESEMIGVLPWWRLQDNCVPKILSLTDHYRWSTKLVINNSAALNNQRLTRNFFQLLLCLYSKRRNSNINNQIMKKITVFLEAFGFSNNLGEYIGLFDYENDYSYNLWGKLTLIIDDIEDNEFNTLVDILKTGTPIDRILEVYKQINKESRKKKLLQECIQLISQKSFDALGIRSIEKSMLVAINTGQLDLAIALLEKGSSIISDKDIYTGRSRKSKKYKNIWESYKYKIDLLKIVKDPTLSANVKKDRLNELKQPILNETYHDGLNLEQDCDRYRRAMFATCIFEEDPETAYLCFDALYKEVKDIQHSGNRLAAKIAFLDKSNAEINKYQQALSEWLETISGSDIKIIQEEFIHNWLICLVKINDHIEIEDLWGKLSDRQQNNIIIATHYCRALKNQGKSYLAKSVFENLKKHHEITNLSEEAEEQLKELNELIVNGNEPLVIAALSSIIENQPKTIDKLRKSYQEICAKKLPELVSIIRDKETTIEEFLYEQILSIIGELQIRKKHLNVPTEKDTSYSITQEDEINDWLTSLFDLMHSEMKISCRDQKRAGQSSTGLNPGEIDFFICDKNSKRIAIMEAFRLFSYDITVIDKHLNKISNYDQECLSPVIILVYCDAGNFSNLCTKYMKNMPDRDYSGFSKSTNKEEVFSPINPGSDTIKTYKEVRYRGEKPITIYHFMVNLRFAP